MPKAKKKDLDKMARIAATGTIKDALLAGGYSPESAARGLAALPQGEREKFKQARHEYALKKLDKFADLGKKVTAEQQESVVRGALLDNVARGKDKATASLKMLGSDRRVNMFTPESATGIIVLSMPPEFMVGGALDPARWENGSLPDMPKTVEARPSPKLPTGDCGWDNKFKAPELPKPEGEN